MVIKHLRAPGVNAVQLTLPPRVMLDVWLHLHASMHAEFTTRATRTHVAAILPQLQRALVAAGAIDATTAAQVLAHILATPARPPLDDQVAALAPEGNA